MKIPNLIHLKLPVTLLIKNSERSWLFKDEYNWFIFKQKQMKCGNIYVYYNCLYVDNNNNSPNE